MTEEQDSSRDPRGLDDLRVVDPRALEGDPFAKRATFLSSLRASGRGWVAAAIAVGVLAIGWQFRAPLSQSVTHGATQGVTQNVTKDVAGGTPATAGAQSAATAPGAVQSETAHTARLRAADPAALKQQLVDELRAAGVDAIGYDRLGLSGVDAKLPVPVPAGVRAALEKYAVGVPADGVVRVEITQSR